MNAIPYVDSLVKEYLVFRGFTKTLKDFEEETKSDKLRGFQVSKITKQLFKYVTTHNLHAMLELWEYLDTTFFSTLDTNFLPTIRKLELSLKRYYVITAISSHHHDKVTEFFRVCSNDLIKDAEWSEWFALPYLKHPETHPTFSGFFTKQWFEEFSASLHNFLTAIFRVAPLPKILNFNQERLNRQTLLCEIQSLQSEVERLRNQLESTEAELKALRAQCEQSASAKHKRRDGEGGKGTSRVRYAAALDPLMSGAVPVPPGPATAAALGPPSNSASFVAAPTLSADDVLAPPAYSVNTAKKTTVIDDVKDLLFTRFKRQPQDKQATPTSTLATPTGSPSSTAAPSDGADPSDHAVDTPSPGASSSPPSSSSPRSPSRRRLAYIPPKSAAQFSVKTVQVFSGHSAPVTRCRFSPTGGSIASASTDGTVRIWPTAGPSSTSGVAGGRTRTGGNATIFCFAKVLALCWEPSPADRLLLCGTGNGKIKLWNAAADKVVGDVSPDPDFPRVVDIDCSLGGRMRDALFAAAAGSLERRGAGLLGLWDLRRLVPVGRVALETGGAVTSVRFNHNGSLLACGCADGHVRVYDVNLVPALPVAVDAAGAATPPAAAIMQWRAHDGEISAVQFSRDETSVLTCGADGLIQQSSMHAAGRMVATYDHAGHGPQADALGDIALDPEGTHFLIGSRHQCGLIYKVASAGTGSMAGSAPTGTAAAEPTRPFQALGGHSRAVVSVDWHPTQNMCLTGSTDHTIRVAMLQPSPATAFEGGQEQDQPW